MLKEEDGRSPDLRAPFLERNALSAEGNGLVFLPRVARARPGEGTTPEFLSGPAARRTAVPRLRGYLPRLGSESFAAEGGDLGPRLKPLSARGALQTAPHPRPGVLQASGGTDAVLLSARLPSQLRVEFGQPAQGLQVVRRRTFVAQSPSSVVTQAPSSARRHTTQRPWAFLQYPDSTAVMRRPEAAELLGRRAGASPQVPLGSPEASPQDAAGQQDTSTRIAALARELVNQCGSLERAFQTLDYNRQGKVSRAQWETGLLTLHFDSKATCGLTSKQLFKMMDSLDPESKNAVSFDSWTRFFGQLEGTEAASMLTEDLGDPMKRRTSSKIRRELLGTPKSPAQEGVSQGAPTASFDFGVLGIEHGSRLSFAERRASNLNEGGAVKLRRIQPQRCVRDEQLLAKSALMLQSHGAAGQPGDGGAKRVYFWDTLPEDDEVAEDTGGAEDGSLTIRSVSESSSDGSEEEDDEDVEFGDEEAHEGLAEAKETLRQLVSEGGAASQQARRLSTAALNVLHGRANMADINSLSENELDGLAEQLVLEEETSQMHLHGTEALAYTLVQKTGSLKKAFQYFDVTNRGKLTLNALDLGLNLLKIDTERLTGKTSTELFFEIQKKQETGFITYKRWKAYFTELLNGNFAEMFQGGSSEASTAKAKDADEVVKKLKERSKRKKQALVERARRQSGMGAGTEQEGGSSGSKSLARGASPAGNANGTGGEVCNTAQKGCPTQDGEMTETTQERQRTKSKSLIGRKSKRVKNRNGRGGSKDAAGVDVAGVVDAAEGGHLSGDRGDDAPFAEAVYRKLSLLESEESVRFEPGLSFDEKDAIQAAADDLGLLCRNHEVVSVHNLKDFREQIREQLLNMEGWMTFPGSLTEAQRIVIYEVAEELDRLTFTETSLRGDEKRPVIFAFNAAGLADSIRKELQVLKPGDVKKYPAQSHLMEVVQTVAQEFGHVGLKNEAGEMEVHRAKDFENVARKILSGLGPGEEYSFPPSLTDEQRSLVEAIAGELGHVHQAQGENKACMLTVANLAAFRGEAEAILDQMKPGETCAVRLWPTPTLSLMQRRIVHSLAEARGWSSESLVDGENRTVSVQRKAQEAPGNDGGLAVGLSCRSADDGDGQDNESAPLATLEDAQKNKGQDMEEETDDEESSEEEEDADPEHCMIQKVFYLYASGSHKGQKIFLRFPDLKDFVNNVQGVMPHWHRTFTNFEHVLENTFVDTVQMQVDMDPVRTSKGLSLKWFQVFIQSAMRKIGMSVLSLLLALLQTVE